MFLEKMNYVFIVILCIRPGLPSIVFISYLSALSLSQIDSKKFYVLERQKGFPSFICSRDNFMPAENFRT